MLDLPFAPGDAVHSAIGLRTPRQAEHVLHRARRSRARRVNRRRIGQEFPTSVSGPKQTSGTIPIRATLTIVDLAVPRETTDHMARCTAPREGHRTSSAAANCPACRGRSRYGYGYGGGYSSPSYSPSSTYSSFGSSGLSGSGGGTKGRVRASWSKPGSAVFYTSAEVRELTPVRANVEVLAAKRPELRDVFLCHAWDDRQSAAKELNDLLEACGVRVWFSEKDIGLGEPFMRSIDKGLANSRVGIVLVTPAMLRTLPKGGVADKELSALLAGERLVPIVHQTTYDALREVSPLLASRNGLNTAEDTMAGVAAKLAELVTI